MEIKDLLRRLHPAAGGSHKDRIRRLNKFRTYVLPHPAVRYWWRVAFRSVRQIGVAAAAAAAAAAASNRIGVCLYT